MLWKWPYITRSGSSRNRNQPTDFAEETNILGDSPPKAHARNFALLGPMSKEIARLNFEGKLKTAVEETGQPQQELDFRAWQATIAYGYPQRDGRRAPGTSDAHGAALIAQP